MKNSFAFLAFTVVTIVQGQKVLQATIGVGFHHKIQPLKHLTDYAGIIEYELLAKDKKSLFSNTWVKYRRGSNELYGLPLPGDEGVSVFFIQITAINKKVFHKIEIFVTSSFGQLLHGIKICTSSLTSKKFTNSLDARYTFVKVLANRLMETKIEKVKINDFQGNCFTSSFLNTEDADGIKCNSRGLKKLRQRLQDGSQIVEEFIREMEISNNIIVTNWIFFENCVEPHTTKLKRQLRWLKTFAPMLVLAAIIGVPICIACYVCRGVRHRQNIMLREQEQVLKEEETRKTEQVKQYQEIYGGWHKKKICGFQSSENMTSTRRESHQKSFFNSKFIDRHIPKVVIDQYVNKNFTIRALNPFDHLLDIRSQNDKDRLKDIHNRRLNTVRKVLDAENSNLL
jgi:hypothetical protein